MSDKPIVLLVATSPGLLDRVKNKPAIPLSLITAACNLPPDFEVIILDQRTDLDWRESLVEWLRKRPVLVGTTAMLGEQISHALKIMSLVKQYSDVPTVWGGSQGGIMPEITVSHPDIDYVIQGDGEEALRELASALANHSRTVDLIPGLWCKREGKPTNLIPRQQVNLDNQPEPLYSHYRHDIQDFMPTRFGRPTLDCELSRGCPYKCAFCFNPYLHGNWRRLSEQRSVERLQQLNKDYGVDSFWFVDDEFFIDLQRSMHIIETCHGNNWSWSIQGVTIRSVIKMNDAYLRKLKEYGCKQLNIGVESGSLRMLKAINKPITPEEVIKVNETLKAVEIIPSYYFIVGFPDEEKSDFNMTLDLVWRLLKENKQAKVMNIGTYSPYPNSVLEKRCIELGYKPPAKLEDYANFGVDQENLPWQVGNKDIIGAGFTNYFLDDKIRDLDVALWIKLGYRLYRPIARWRFAHKQFGCPIDIGIGRKLKEIVRK
jgi:anaerobic magnesium-protoporphyrin IX monomethyl ester cyclase